MKPVPDHPGHRCLAEVHAEPVGAVRGASVTVEVQQLPSIFFAGKDGNRIPVMVTHGEGFADFSSAGEYRAGQCGAARCRQPRVTQTYPLNPSGSSKGITLATTTNGGFTALIPHPERVFRAVPWAPDAWKQAAKWGEPLECEGRAAATRWML